MLSCMFYCLKLIDRHAGPIVCFLVKEFRGRNFLRGGECNNPHSTHRRIVEYLFLFHTKTYGHVELGDDYWGNFSCS